jgi:hypothetical protein
MDNCQIRFSARETARVDTTLNAGKLAGANKPQTSETAERKETLNMV